MHSKKATSENAQANRGFVTSNNAQDALKYFNKWYGEEPLKWLEQFRCIPKRKDELELLTTVDMAIVNLRKRNSIITMLTVKNYIQQSSEWRKKLTREIFSDNNITRAIKQSIELFGEEVTV
ncbi:MAG: hypothetical protein LBE70_02090 [Nitrososphaerota archaeon]|nr:hypothetical protein [Nitrososphaerota archaeon]